MEDFSKKEYIRIFREAREELKRNAEQTVANTGPETLRRVEQIA
jgi:hypothetical protein